MAGDAPPWPGVLPPAPTRCPCAASASVALSRSTSTLDSTHLTSSLDVVGLHRGCGAELEWGVMQPPWPGVVLHPHGLARDTCANTVPACRLGHGREFPVYSVCFGLIELG